MILLASLLILTFFGHIALAQNTSCLEQLVLAPITQNVLSNAKEQYKDIPLEQDPWRTVVLLRLGYADSNQVIDSNIQVQTIALCMQGVKLLRVVGTEHTVDETMWLVTEQESAITSTTIIAALQTQCDNTFLRVCSVNKEGKLLIQQLNHVFECSEQEFLRTDLLPSFIVDIDNNNVIQEVFLEE